MKTESNIRPASQFEIEALPPIEGRSCTIILYDNIQGPFTRQASGEDQEPQEYFTFDRYWERAKRNCTKYMQQSKHI